MYLPNVVLQSTANIPVQLFLGPIRIGNRSASWPLGPHNINFACYIDAVNCIVKKQCQVFRPNFL
jgi:hypothetical protein